MRSQVVWMLVALVASKKVAVRVGLATEPVVGERVLARGKGGVGSGKAETPWGCQPEFCSVTERAAR